MRESITLNINDYLSEVQKEIFEVINNNKNILISATPATGKTTLFANLCVERNSPSIHNNRIVFCSPYLIIQEQFKQRLIDSKVTVNFELNGECKRKKLEVDDKIITSTFKSFPRISESLKPEDIVIIDEAHSLLNVYSDKKNKKHDHFGNFYKALYSTKAKVVLMTGTPVDSFHYWFDSLQEIKVLKDSLKAKVNIQYSTQNENEIVIQFAKESIKKYGAGTLNVIYVKNKNKCDKFLEIIRSHKYRGLVLTSDSKLTSDYKLLVEQSFISKKYQFLITTNVISTGTNILNDNMGGALILNERDPIEIKQFSKRFRNKLDIEIDVVNKYQKPIIELEKNRVDLKEQRNLNRFYLKQIKQILSTKITLYMANQLDFNAFEGEASSLNVNELNDAFLKRNLLQEIYYHQEITKTYNDKIELVKALNEFDDIISVDIQEHEINHTEILFDENAYIKDKKKYLHNIIDDFNKYHVAYLIAYNSYISANHKYSPMADITTILNRFNITENSTRKSKKVTVNLEVVREIISPFVEYYPLFSLEIPDISLTRCLDFIKNVAPNKRSKHLISLWFNEKFRNDFKIPENYDIENLDLISINTLDSKNNVLISFFLNQTFLFLMSHEQIYYQDFKNSILNSSENKDFSPDELFPFTSRLTIKKGTIKDFDTSFGLGLLYSIIAIQPKQIQRAHPKVKNKGRVNTILPAELDSIQNFTFINEQECREMIKSLEPIKTIPPTYNFNSINLNESERVIVDKNYLTLLASYSG